MIRAFVLLHPQSVDLLTRTAFRTKHVQCATISCGTTKVRAKYGAIAYSEANDFHPTYAPWNSVLFETSVILTLWEHAQQLVGDDHIAILHSDVIPHFHAAPTWMQLERWLIEHPHRAIGLTAPAAMQHSWDDWLVPSEVKQIPKNDPMLLHQFDHKIDVWDYIKVYDYDLYEWAMDTQPLLIYAHQFACSRVAFDHLGSKLYAVAQRLRLHEVGLWTPHVFERLIALYLARYGGMPLLTTCFWHMSSSGAQGPGGLNLYGSRPRRFYKLRTRWNDQFIPAVSASS